MSGSKGWDAKMREKLLVVLFAAAAVVIAAESAANNGTQKDRSGSHGGPSGYHHVWPEIRFGWEIVVGSIIGFFGAACGSVGGVGGGGIFVPMLTLIIGFDAKSSTAMSKCMVTGAAASTVYYNLKLRHPTLELPVIDYDLALLFQPMLVLGVSIGVALNVVFANWMITILLIILFLVTSSMSFFKGVETWSKETKSKKAAKQAEVNENGTEEDPADDAPKDEEEPKRESVSLIENVYWKKLGLLMGVWMIILGLQILKNYTTTCSVQYWLLNAAQIPVAFGVSGRKAIKLYKGETKLASKGEAPGATSNWEIKKLIFYLAMGIFAGVVGGMLGLGGGFIMGPLFIEMGVPPQVASATSTFAMMFSASLSVVEYYLLKRFPVPYALYFFGVATVAALVGQHVVRKLIKILGRASLIIFFLAFTIFVSAISLGGVGLARFVRKIERKEYLGFEDLCGS